MLETADLILRPGTADDGPALHASLWRHASVFQYLFSRPSPDEAAGAELPKNGQPVTLAHYILRKPESHPKENPPCI